MNHKDPTFEAVARLESKDCTKCQEFTRLWGLEYCNKRKWSGIKNMKRCQDWTYQEWVYQDLDYRHE